jgi:cytochrome c biogenesis protein CcdA/glutaredoxin
MKKIIISLLILLAFSAININQTDGAALADSSQNYLFYGDGCGHCVTVEKYFDENNIDEEYQVERKETWKNSENKELFNQICEENNITRRGVPTLFFEGEILIGDTPIINFFENKKPTPNPSQERNNILPTPIQEEAKISEPVILAEQESKNCLFFSTGCAHCGKVDKYFQENNILEQYNIEEKNISGDAKCAQEFNVICQDNGIPLGERGIPMLYFEGQCLMGDTPIIDFFKNKEFQNPGKNNPGNEPNNDPERDQMAITIPIVISGALVDAINPCEFAVLILLLTTILVHDNRKKSLQAGLAFSTSMFISYYLMGLGLYGVVATAGLSSTFMKIIGVLAILVGLFNLKDYFWYGKGFVMEVPLSWRPTMKKLIRSVTSPIGAFFVGFLVSLFLLPCTSGPYIVVMGMLGNTATFHTALWMLLLYNLIFISPMVLITLGVYKGLDPKKLEKTRMKNVKLLHLIAGIIMLGMGAVILWGVV